MAATSKVIRRWLENAKSKGALHVIVVCDTYDHEDYPIYLMPNDSVEEELADISKQNMQSIMEIYNLNLDIDQQMKEFRCWHIDGVPDSEVGGIIANAGRIR